MIRKKMRTGTILLTLSLITLSLAQPVFAAAPNPPVSILKKSAALVFTGDDNSLVPDPSLFSLVAEGRQRVLRTESEDTNIHAHYIGGRSSTFTNYLYSGELRILDEEGGIGVTFYSDYLRSDTYYRLRRYDDEPTFRVEPHGTEMTAGVCDTLVSPLPGEWYKFKVLVKNIKGSVRIRAKVWRAGVREPKRWQVDCRDSSGDRIAGGRPGVWSMGPGRKEWRRLVVGPGS